MRAKLIQFSLYCQILLPAICNAGAEWVVSPDAPKGDSAKGAVTRFATLEDAIKAVTGSGGTAVAAGLTIRLAPGTHRLSGTLVLGNAVSGTKSAPLRIVGSSDRKTVISGTKVLLDHSKVDDAGVLARLPVTARNNVVQFKLREHGIEDFGPLVRRGFGEGIEAGQIELFFRGRPMTVARWPNDGYARIEQTDGKLTFVLPRANTKALAAETHVLATGYWAKDWADQTIPVQSVDPRTGTITLQSPAPRHGIEKSQRAFLQNALCELDSAGEWYVDRKTGILYFWPPEQIAKGDVEISVVPRLVATNAASFVHLSQLTLEGARGDAIAISGGTGVVVEYVTVRNSGGRAVTAAGTEHRISNLDVYDVGEGGVYLSGGDRQTLRSGNMSVDNSHIRRFNRQSRTYRPAVQLNGVGNRALGNVISDGTHNAVLIIGNDHLVAFNEVFRVATETGDVGAIYIGRDWTARGTVIRNNFLHDIRGPGLHGSTGVYLDDQASGISVTSNLFVRVHRAILVGGGRDNVVEGNVVVSSSPAVQVDARGIAWQKDLSTNPQGEFRKRLAEVPYNRAPYSERYPNLPKILDDEPGAPKYTVVRGNVLINSGPIQLTLGANRWVKVEATVESGPENLISGTQALKGTRPADFALKSNVGGTTPPLPLEQMQCVATRLDQLRAGRSVDCRIQ
jgi:hypothetical protein